MDLFEQISREKQDFPKIHSVTNQVKGYKMNFYQMFAIGMFIVCFFLGIVFGNLFSTCETSSYFYSNVCLVKEFNFSLMIVIWSFSLLVSIVIFSVGHIIAILNEINKKLGKFHV